jgi:hypothetical protein
MITGIMQAHLAGRAGTGLGKRGKTRAFVLPLS